jgi:hypothetical protein
VQNLLAGTSMLALCLFLLAIDNVIVIHKTDDPLAAVGLLFGSYYIFNLHYPAAASITLEFIQK